MCVTVESNGQWNGKCTPLSALIPGARKRCPEPTRIKGYRTSAYVGRENLEGQGVFLFTFRER
jgi:hypothetical protein